MFRWIKCVIYILITWGRVYSHRNKTWQTVTVDYWKCVCHQSKLEEINSVLSAQYECRRRLLIKRLDVTVQSFSWSDRAKARQHPHQHTLPQSHLHCYHTVTLTETEFFNYTLHFTSNMNPSHHSSWTHHVCAHVDLCFMLICIVSVKQCWADVMQHQKHWSLIRSPADPSFQHKMQLRQHCFCVLMCCHPGENWQNGRGVSVKEIFIIIQVFRQSGSCACCPRRHLQRGENQQWLLPREDQLHC